MKIYQFIAKLLLVSLYLYSGVDKILHYSATKTYVISSGLYLPINNLITYILPLVILLELAGSIAILIGFYTEIAAILFALYTLVADIYFHIDYKSHAELLMFFAELGLVGAFMLLAVHSHK